ncbi:unnamed protein product, partial [Ascophyllum nodosum]
MGSAAEHAAPGEEQVVFSRTAGVVASKVSYIDVLDSTNDWNILENPHDDDAIPLTFEFNHRGTHLGIGDEAGRIDIWTFVPVRLYVKSLALTPQVLDALRPAPPFPANANSNANSNGNYSSVGIQGHGWSSVSIHWSRCSRYMVAAYFPRRKLWPNGEEVLLPGMVAFWDVVEGHVESYLRLACRVAHVSLSPRDPRRGTLSSTDGTTYVVDFPIPSARRTPVNIASNDLNSVGAEVDAAAVVGEEPPRGDEKIAGGALTEGVGIKEGGSASANDACKGGSPDDGAETAAAVVSAGGDTGDPQKGLDAEVGAVVPGREEGCRTGGASPQSARA